MSDFDSFSWHDNLIYGLHFQCAEPDKNIWLSNLIFDIDYILEWIQSDSGKFKFRVAPANLVFHDVQNLAIEIPGGPPGHGQTLSELSIHEIERGPQRNKTGSPITFYDWSIELHFPNSGKISFEATGFTQTLREEPQLLDQQGISASIRPPFTIGR
ncbi:MAG: hypothetical protein NXI13_09690 [Proteobacteria bacterium]|nr:hypothetical protein [Pseudomonadota bacterium]